MSHKVTFDSPIKDGPLAKAALDAAKFSYTESGPRITITSGPLNRATIDLTTGEIISDSDWHTKEQLGILRQHYSEAEFRRMALREGVTIQSRQVLQGGVVRLSCRG
jgi:hypothetical protein